MNERKIIAINLIFVLIMSLSGIYFGTVGNSSSLLTDGIVSLVIFLSSSIGIFVHSMLNKNNDYLYPFGKWRFEYVYNFIRLMVLTIIIGYSIFEATKTIIDFFIFNQVTQTVDFSKIIIYFPIKLITALVSLLWLKHNKSNLDDEYYSIERDSVFVDAILTTAILIGLSIISRIDSISAISDSLTLLLISFILLYTIGSELKHLIYILIGKRIYTNLEQDLFSTIDSDFNITDIHIEKFGIVYIVFITCSFVGTKTINEIEEFEQYIGLQTEKLGISKYRVELNFKK